MDIRVGSVESGGVEVGVAAGSVLNCRGFNALDRSRYSNDAMGFMRWWNEIVDGPRLCDNQVENICAAFKNESDGKG